MPKTNDQTGATAAGMTGIVEHGAPIDGGRRLSELDPEVNLDGTLIDGEHPDHPKTVERDHVAPTGAPEPVESQPEPATEPDDEGREEESSPGISSRTSTAKTGSSRGKSRGSA